MKKILVTAVAAAIIVGGSALNASAWNHGPMMGWGNGMMYGSGATIEEDQKFLDATKEIKIQIAADQAELNAIMAGQNPDSKRVRELSESIATNQLAFQDQSRSHGYDRMRGNYMRGGGMMNGGYGCRW
jgi:hypothetical protein